MTRHIDRNRRNLLRGIGVAGVAGLAGCTGGNGDDDGGDDGSGDGLQARVGVLMPETGDLGSLGTTMRDGALLAATQVNDSDVDLNVDTSVEDTQTDPQAGISGAQALVNSGYPAVVGSASSNVNLQVTREVFIPNQVVGISPSSTSPAVTDLDDNGYIFRTCPSDALQGPVMSEVATGRVDASTSATVFLNDDYGQALEEAYVNAFEDAGGEVTNRVSIEPEQASYSSQWSEALTDDPDAVMVVAFPESGIQLFSDYYNEFASDNDSTIIVPDGLIDDSLPDEVDNDFANVIGTSPASAGPGAEYFASAYEDEYGESPQVFNAQSFDAMAVCILATAAAGEADGTAIRDNMETVANPEGEEITPENLSDGVQMALDGDDINYQGASSPVDFDENGDMRSVTYGIYEVQDRVFEEIDQIDFEN